MIVFRVHITNQSGLGHLVRCSHLIKQLQKKNVDCLIIGDVDSPKVRPFTEGTMFIGLYDQDQKELDQKKDAQLSLQFIEQNSVQPLWVIVDHYHLDASWENEFVIRNYQVLAVDDLERFHVCQVLLDFRWRRIPTKITYQTKVLPKTSFLTGTQYCLMSSEPPEMNPEYHSDETFHILISLGGGGQAKVLLSILNALIHVFAEHHTPVHIKVIVGPLMSDAKLLEPLEAEADESEIHVEVIKGKTNLDEEFQWCHFFLGAAGGSLYSIRSLKKPALTFSIVGNQLSDQNNLDDIGHYFHLNQWNEQDCFNLALFMLNCRNEYGRIASLFSNPKVEIGFNGPKNVAEYLMDGKRAPASLIKVQTAEIEYLGKDKHLRPVRDSDINHYLASRNLKANRRNMLDTIKIPQLNHYLWWFQTRRRSFLMTEKEVPILYIWDEVKEVDGQPYLIGGWFVCHDAVNFQEAMVALNWQLEKCAQDYPNVPWVAVISRNNRYVKLMNDYFGFKEVETGCRYTSVINTLFPKARTEDFYYVYKETVSS